MEDKNWRSVFFMTLIVGVFLFVFFPITPQEQTEVVDGTLVKYFWDLDDGTRVYYEGVVPTGTGIGTFELTGVCSSTTNECRNPTTQELQQDKYIPQSNE